ncbi:MAG: fibronectin type III domain-containing protein, partial [Candidatus Hydrogenedens sp.]
MIRVKNLNVSIFVYTLIFFITLLTAIAPIFADVKTPPDRETPFPITQVPAQITLTLTETPSTSMTIQWSTSPEVKEGIVEWHKKTEQNKESTKRTSAKFISIIDPSLKNNPEIYRWFVTLNSLEPNTNYEYRVGNPNLEIWSDWYTFKTEPTQAKTFSFIYLGDAQNGLEEWGKLLKKSIEKCPDCSFILMAGDLVNRGNERDDWDAFFHYADNIFAQYPIVPTIGNHEYKSNPLLPKMYLDFFVLPTNGPANITSEFCYSVKYLNAQFIILNANHNPEQQVPWLEHQLSGSSSLWKFLLFHQPFYSSAPRRDNKHLRDAWLPLIDQYHVDIVFQGHDHSYWRTYPLKNNQKVSPTEGTYYVISFSGTKSYEQQEKTEIIEIAFEKIPTYQIITIEKGISNRLIYRSFDMEGTQRDEFIINKAG